LAVEITLANTAPISNAPTKGGRPWRAVKGIVSRGLLASSALCPKSAVPKTAMATINVSSTTVPAIQPTTATRGLSQFLQKRILVHALIAQHEQKSGKEIIPGFDECHASALVHAIYETEAAQPLKIFRRQRCMQS